MFPYTDLMNYIFSNLWLSGLQGTSRDPYKCFKTIRDFLNKLHRSGGLCSYCGILHKYKGQVTDKVRYKSQLLVSKATLVYKVVFSWFLTVNIWRMGGRSKTTWTHKMRWVRSKSAYLRVKDVHVEVGR